MWTLWKSKSNTTTVRFSFRIKCEPVRFYKTNVGVWWEGAGGGVSVVSMVLK